MDNLALKTKYTYFTGSSAYDNFLKMRNSSSTSEAGFNATTTPSGYTNSYYNMKNPAIYKPKGKLVHGSIIPNPFKGLVKAGKDFKKAMNGQGTDYSIGKLNDPALALGTLSIATVLATAEKSAFTKAMKFVGAGAWLASMHIWPKIVLAPPIKALTGVDMNLEYVNAQNEQKPFWMDPGYVPDELLPREMLDKAGKKLKVPENIKNRDEEIKSRMKQVATGVNTWWMLSAGFATPFMASLIGYGAERPVENILNYSRMRLAEAHLEAVGIDTGSKNPLVKIGKGIIKMFSNVSGDASKGELKKLGTLIQKDDLEKLQKFFRDSVPSDKFRPYINNLVETASNQDNYQEELVNLYKNVKKANPLIAALEKFSHAGDNIWGVERRRSLEKLINNLGIGGKDLRTLAENEDRNVRENCTIIQRNIQRVAKNGQTDKVVGKMEKAIEGPIKIADWYEETLDKIGKSIVKIFNGDDSVSEAARTTIGKVTRNAEDKALGIRATFEGFPGIVRQGAKNIAAIWRFDGNDLWNHLDKMETTKRNGFLDNFFGKGNKIIGKIMGFVENPGSREGLAVRMFNAMGEPPPDLLSRGAEQVHGRGSWFRKIGILGTGALVASTVLALWKISENAKTKNKVKEEKV